MKVSRFAQLVAGFWIAYVAEAQTGAPSSRTVGACSPAMTGNNNQVTISCSGISALKANQLIAVMNRVLAEHLDLHEVESKLNDLHGEVNQMNSTLNRAMNWQSVLPQRTQSLINKGTELAKDCNDLSEDSLHAHDAQQRTYTTQKRAALDRYTRDVEVYRQQTNACLQAMRDGHPCSQQPVPPRIKDLPHPPSLLLQEQSPEQLAAFKINLEPRLEAWRDAVAKDAPRIRYSDTSFAVSENMTPNEVCMSFQRLYGEYTQWAYSKAKAQ